MTPTQVTISSPECIVVGASAVGSMAAAELASRGVSTIVFEEHSVAGKFHKCSGLFSRRGLEELGVPFKDSVLNSVRGARLFSGKRELSVESSTTQAYVTDRQKFDEGLAEHAHSKGASFIFDARVEKVNPSGSSVALSTPAGSFSPRILVGADGASSTVAREAGFPASPPSDFVLAWEAEYSNAQPTELHSVHVFLEPSLFPGFFGWTIPVSDERVRVGFGTSDFPTARAAQRAILSLPDVSSQITSGKACLAREFYHLIPVRTRPKTQAGNVLLVGDSAGQTKATTGGGVIFGGRCAKVAAHTIAAHLQEGAPLSYESAWRKEVGRTLSAHRMLRSFYNTLSPSTISGFTRLSQFMGASALLSRFGDMDYLVA